MDNIIIKLGTIIDQSNDHFIIKVKYNDIRCLIKKWSKNRDCDPVRAKEIAESIKKGSYVPKIIYLASIDSEGIVCYDGNTRRNAFNLLVGTEFEINEILIDIIFDISEVKLRELFIDINKNISVPDIYIESGEDSNSKVKLDIIQLVKTYTDKYKTHSSSSNKCTVPNFNRDLLIDNIYSIYKEYDGCLSISKIEETMSLLNEEYKSGKYPSTKETVTKKCKQSGLYLFQHKNCINMVHFKEVLDSYAKTGVNVTVV
jgi:hypothetical protein